MLWGDVVVLCGCVIMFIKKEKKEHRASACACVFSPRVCGGVRVCACVREGEIGWGLQF